jgi:hypothetical protein
MEEEREGQSNYSPRDEPEGDVRFLRALRAQVLVAKYDGIPEEIRDKYAILDNFVGYIQQLKLNYANDRTKMVSMYRGETRARPGVTTLPIPLKHIDYATYYDLPGTAYFVPELRGFIVQRGQVDDYPMRQYHQDLLDYGLILDDERGDERGDEKRCVIS